MHPFLTRQKSRIADQAFKEILEALEGKLAVSSDSRDQFIQLKGQHTALLRQYLSNTMDWEVYQRQLNQFGSRLMEFINHLSESDLKKENPVVDPDGDAWRQVNILALAPETEEVAEMNYLFKRFPFQNWEVVTEITWAEGEAKMDHPHILVVDNRDLGSCASERDLEGKPEDLQTRIRQRIEQMEKLSEQAFLLHFGGHLYWVGQNRDRVYAANSKFSLYGRLKEMAEFVSAFQALGGKKEEASR